MDTPDALIADLAKTIRLPEIPLDENAGWHLNLGSDDAYLYCRDGKNLLIVVPVTQLPADIAWAQTNSLLRENLFDSSFSPFQIATDAGGMIIQWGLLPIADLNGPAIVDILENLGRRAEMLRAMLEPPKP